MVVVANVVDKPVTTPADVTVAIAGAKLPHTPPGVPEVVNVTWAALHTLSNPVIIPAFGNGLTVTDNVVEADPQLNVVEV
jgi:hypothetical protein